MKRRVRIFLMGFLMVILLGVPSLISGNSKQASYLNSGGLKVPSFVTNIPPDHFLGISMPSNSLAEARKSAIDDVIRQIMAGMGMEYSHQYVNRISGNVRNPLQVIDDKLSGHSHGFIQDVQASALESCWLINATGRYIFFYSGLLPYRKNSRNAPDFNGRQGYRNCCLEK